MNEVKWSGMEWRMMDIHLYHMCNLFPLIKCQNALVILSLIPASMDKPS